MPCGKKYFTLFKLDHVCINLGIKFLIFLFCFFIIAPLLVSISLFLSMLDTGGSRQGGLCPLLLAWASILGTPRAPVALFPLEVCPRIPPHLIV